MILCFHYQINLYELIHHQNAKQNKNVTDLELEKQLPIYAFHKWLH